MQLEGFLVPLSPTQIQSNLVELDVRQQVFPSVYADAAFVPNYQVVGWHCSVVELYSLHESVYTPQVVENVASRPLEGFLVPLSPTQIQSNLVELDVRHQVFPSVYSGAVCLPNNQVVGWHCSVVEFYSLHSPVCISQVLENAASRPLDDLVAFPPTQIQSNLVELDVQHQVFPSVYSGAVGLPNDQVVGCHCIAVELYSLHDHVYIPQVLENVASRRDHSCGDHGGGY
jgi:hypothetical protein